MDSTWQEPRLRRGRKRRLNSRTSANCFRLPLLRCADVVHDAMHCARPPTSDGKLVYGARRIAAATETLGTVAVSDRAVDCKYLAAQCFQSQFEPGADGSAPVLPGLVLQRLLAVGEVVFR